MATKILKITNIHVIDSAKIALAGGLLNQSMSSDELANIIGSVVTVADNSKDLFNVQIMDLQMSTSLAGFKEIFILVENKYTEATLVGNYIVMD